ncbi:MAG: DNA alkylation repair protein [Chloroflexota bacterium]
MPAIQPARLKLQAAELAASFPQPGVFVRGLDDLCEFYANRTYRPGVSGESRPSLLKAYNVPAPVLREVQHALIPSVSADPQAALALCQALWEEPILEHRLLAAGVLGELPPADSAAQVELLRSWIESIPEEQVLTAVLQQGTRQLRQHQPERLLALAEGWLNRTQVLWLQAGLRLLETLAGEPGFENLPAIYTRITSLARTLPAPARSHMVALLRALLRRAPSEAAFFLRDNLKAPNNPDTPWLIRQLLDEFPQEIQNSLRQSLREQRLKF